MKQGITIFTDGSSRGNPGPGGWGAIVVYENSDKKLSADNQRLVQELGGGEKRTTNNRMELTAVIEALLFVSKLTTGTLPLKTTLYLDSSYVLNGATKWIHGWKKNNWKTSSKDPVLNQDLWETLAKILPYVDVEWKLIKGHSGVSGNERCDVIATSFADGLKPELYKGNFDSYDIDVSVSTKLTAHNKKTKSKSSAKAYSYVSSVNGVIKTHRTWAECEKRVKGVPGTRFKKSFSAEDEKAIIASWKALR